jgi:hypothetical protein
LRRSVNAENAALSVTFVQNHTSQEQDLQIPPEIRAIGQSNTSRIIAMGLTTATAHPKDGWGESNPAKSACGIGHSVLSPFRMRNAAATNNPAVAGADPGTASSFGGNEIR